MDCSNTDQYGRMLNGGTAQEVPLGLGSQMIPQSLATGAVGYLKPPANPAQQIVLTQTIPALSAINQFFVGDFCGLGEVLGLVGGVNSDEFDATNGIDISNIKNYLATYAIVVGGYNFLASNSQSLSNNLKAITPELDTNSSSFNLFSAQSVSNMQFNQNLLNIDQPFVWTNQTALRIPVQSDPLVPVTYTLTIKILACVPYGRLDTFLEGAKIIQRSKLNC